MSYGVIIGVSSQSSATDFEHLYYSALSTVKFSNSSNVCLYCSSMLLYCSRSISFNAAYLSETCPADIMRETTLALSMTTNLFDEFF